MFTANVNNLNTACFLVGYRLIKIINKDINQITT